MEEIIQIFLNVCILLFSITLIFLSIVGYKRRKNTRLLFTTAGFTFFFIKGIVLTLGSFLPIEPFFSQTLYLYVFDVIVLSFLFLATLKKR